MSNNSNDNQQKNVVAEHAKNYVKNKAKNYAKNKAKKVGLLVLKKASTLLFSKIGLILLAILGVILITGLVVTMVTPNMTTKASTNKTNDDALTQEYLQRNAFLSFKYNIQDIRFPLMLTMGKFENVDILDVSPDESAFMLFDMIYDEYVPPLKECTYITENELEDGTIEEIVHTEVSPIEEGSTLGGDCVKISDKRTLRYEQLTTKDSILDFMLYEKDEAVVIEGAYPKRKFIVDDLLLYVPFYPDEQFVTVEITYSGTPLEEGMVEWEYDQDQTEHIEIIKELPEAVDELFDLHDVSLVGSHIGNGAFCVDGGTINNSAITNTFSTANKLKNYESTFRTVAAQHNLDLVLVVSIAMYLTENGSSEALSTHNNIEGLFDSVDGKIKNYNSIEDGIKAFGSSLNKHINQNGNKTIETLGKIYALSNENTVTSAWSSNIGLSVSKLGGLTKNCLNYSESNIVFEGDVSETRQKIASVGTRWIGNSRYVFGGGRNQNDIARGFFDCSSFVHWAYAQAGINLGNLTSTSTETLNKMGTRISINEIQVGDIIFWDSYKRDGHVAIYVGNGKFIGAQSSTGVAIVPLNDRYWSGIFSGHVRRLIN